MAHDSEHNTVPAPLEARANRCRAALLAAYDVEEVFAAAQAYLQPFAIRVAHEVQYSALSDTANHLSTSLRAMLQHDTVSSEDIQDLRTEGQRSVDSGRQDIGMLVLVFCARLSGLMEHPRPNAHCHFQMMDLHCASCGSHGQYRVWRVVNAVQRPDLRESARRGDLTRLANCNSCDRRLDGCSPFFYCDPSRGEYLIYFPPEDPHIFKEMLQGCVRYLGELPADFKCSASYAAYYEGFHGPWTGPLPECMPVFKIRSAEQFRRIVNEELYESCPLRLPDGATRVNAVNAIFREGDYCGAAQRYGQMFLDDQLQWGVLRMLSDSLAASGKQDLAKRIATKALELRERLRQEGIIRSVRLNRNNQSDPRGSGVPNNPLVVRIWEDGLPAAWGFGELVELVKGIIDPR